MGGCGHGNSGREGCGRGVRETWGRGHMDAGREGCGCRVKETWGAW